LDRLDGFCSPGLFALQDRGYICLRSFHQLSRLWIFYKEGSFTEFGSFIPNKIFDGYKCIISSLVVIVVETVIGVTGEANNSGRLQK
jgi:hypothetical protein